jgi:hypothetical protein
MAANPNLEGEMAARAMGFGAGGKSGTSLGRMTKRKSTRGRGYGR